EQALGFAMQAVGPRPERHERAGVTRGLPLAPREPRQREAEQPDQYLGRATEMRELRHEAQGRAGAALPRSGDRIPLAFRREHAVGLVEGRDLPGARARQEPELGGHWLRVAR